MFWLERKIETRARAGNESARGRSGPRAPEDSGDRLLSCTFTTRKKSLMIIGIQSVKSIDARMLLTRYNEEELREVGVSTVLNLYT